MVMIKYTMSQLETPFVSLRLSNVFPGTLALMSDIYSRVQSAYPRLSIDWGYAFLKPLLKTYEALIALVTREGCDTANQGLYSIGLGGLLQPMSLGLRLLKNSARLGNNIFEPMRNIYQPKVFGQLAKSLNRDDIAPSTQEHISGIIVE